MEILILVLLYYLSQNPDFHEKLKPLASGLKNSEQMLSFLKDLSKFSEVFNQAMGDKKQDGCHEEKPPRPPKDEKSEKQEKEPRSPTAGIADDFIQQMLEGYLKK